MFYIYRSFSIAGWIAAIVFFLYLGAVVVWRRAAASRRGFPVEPRDTDSSPGAPRV